MEKIGLSLVLIAPVAGACAIVFAAWLARAVLKKETGPLKMSEFSVAIRTGVRVYLTREFFMIAVFGMALSVILGYVLGALVAFAFAVGAALSALSAFVGVIIAVYTNVRTAQAARKGFDEAFTTANLSGTVAGMFLAGLALLGVSLLYFAFRDPFPLLGLGFGASLVCLFARVGGGIYTKAADIGADLVGKVEVGIPEDDPRNPAVIADLVGDNVGDIAGTGSDVFQSYVMALVAAMILGGSVRGVEHLTYPLIVAGTGIFSSIIATLFVRSKGSSPQTAIYHGMYGAAILVILFAGLSSWILFKDFREFYPSVIGTATVVLFAWVTLHYTSPGRRPVLEIAEASVTGPATNVIFGLGRGFESTVFPLVIFSLASFLAFDIDGLYGISMVAVGFLSVNATLIAMSSYGPIVDNAKGIIQFAGFRGEAMKVTDSLDAVGNTTKAVCKVYAIETSAFAQIAIFSALISKANLTAINLAKPTVISGLLIGGMISFLVVSQILRAVGKTAYRMIEEVRRQFREVRGLREGKAGPDYTRCVDISTKGALRSMYPPAALTIVIPLLVGYLFGVEAVGGLIAGNLVTTLPLALMMVQGGAAWDNAKKYVEAGNLGGAGTPTHAAAVIGDAVGDPMKDAAGASLDVLMNLIGSMVTLFAASFMAYTLFPH